MVLKMIPKDISFSATYNAVNYNYILNLQVQLWFSSQVWLHKPLISALERQRQFRLSEMEAGWSTLQVPGYLELQGDHVSKQ